MEDYIILRDSNDYKNAMPWQELFTFDHKLTKHEFNLLIDAVSEAMDNPDYTNEDVEEEIYKVIPYTQKIILDNNKIIYF